ncbi:MAG: AMP-binding protein [Candidatus Marinimicrobia bacterium]|nr:AMP-binding protein [Candidatus Neomarinimicrobiota bacterium]
MKASWSKRTLNFKRPAGTSRGVMKIRDIWYIFLSEDGKTGVGECAPLTGLSLDDFIQIESKLGEVCVHPKSFIKDLSQLTDFPSIRFGLEMACMDLMNGGGQSYYRARFTRNNLPININGLIWMGDQEFMIQQVEQKLEEGWRCIKMKIGALDFDTEINILKSIRSRFSRDEIELRVDANGAFTESTVKEKLNRLMEFDLHSIEQPIKAGQWELLSELCKVSPVPIALDEDLIPLVNKTDRIRMLDKVKPQFLVLKPSLLGGFLESEKWIKLAEERNIGWWITSALESNIGLNAIAQWTAKIKPKGFQGLGTGQLFTNNIPSPLNVESGKLWLDDAPIWTDINQFISEWLNPGETMELQTSGSTGEPKIITVQKEWMRNSAKLTGKTFGLKEGNTALLCMPMKYIAGKMMVVRSIELDLVLKVLEPSSYPLKEIESTIDFAAMVPLQLEKSIDQLDKVKTLIIGGGPVNQNLINRLQSVPTKVFETYGMTETLTHVAIKPLNGPDQSEVLKAIAGIRFETDERDCLVIHAPMVNPDPVVTNDIVDLINETSFHWLGRFDNVINSGGVKIIPEVVEKKLASVIPNRRFFVTGLSDESLGEKVVLVMEGEEIGISFEPLEKNEKPREIIYCEKFEVTKSGKIHRINTIKMIKG